LILTSLSIKISVKSWWVILLVEETNFTGAKQIQSPCAGISLTASVVIGTFQRKIQMPYNCRHDSPIAFLNHNIFVIQYCCYGESDEATNKITHQDLTDIFIESDVKIYDHGL
jgi:hypothetical protein